MSDKKPLILIEDDPIQQRILKTMLEETYTVQAYASYQSARKGLKNSPIVPSLILCDITLPDGNGMELRQELLGDENLVACPFIFLSSRDDDTTKHDAAQLGIDDFLSKPIKKEELLNTLERTIKRSENLKQNLNKRLDRELTDPLQPVIPPLIGQYHFTLAHQQVTAGGGDFVFYLHNDGHHYIVMGDVMGHGAPAKFFLHAYAGYLYGLFRSFRHYGMLPNASAMLNILNEAMAEDDFLKRWLMTCLVLSIPEGGDVTLANAGHPFAWLSNAEGVHPLSRRGPMPGLMTDLAYQDSAVILQPGERLYLSSDGIPLERDILEHLRGLATDKAAAELMAIKTADDATLVIMEKI